MSGIVIVGFAAARAGSALPVHKTVSAGKLNQSGWICHNTPAVEISGRNLSRQRTFYLSNSPTAETMISSDLSSPPVAKPSNHPIVGMIAAFPIACFTCALFTDIAYVQTAQMMWADFSDWLLAVGMAGGVVAGLAGLVSLLLQRNRERSGPVWPIVLGSALVLIVAFFNNLVHSRDAWTSVMPTGLALSVLTVLLILATAFLNSKQRYSRTVVMPYGAVRE